MSEERKNRFRGAYLDQLAWAVRRMEEDCESELERLFLLALLQRQEESVVPVPTDLQAALKANRVVWGGSAARLWCHQAPRKLDWEEPCVPIPKGKWHLRSDELCFVWIVPQMEISTAENVYRADFAFLPLKGSACPPFIVELDGHNFHERTKKQAARDRSRDRAMQASGFQVIRFTGSELWRDPLKCVRDVQVAMFWEDARRDPDTLAYLPSMMNFSTVNE